MQRSAGQEAIPDGWQRVRLGDVADFQQGGTPSKANTEYWDGNIPFVTGADLGQRSIGRASARSFLTERGLTSGSTAICNAGALLLATRTRVGLVGIASEVLGASQYITLLTAKDVADHGFLFWLLDNRTVELQRRSRGTTIQGVTREDIDSLPILLPPLPEQRAIAAVLDSIDDAIEGAEAVIAATEQLRDSLLHDLLTRGLPGQHTEWRDVSGLVTIPADWEVFRLGDVLEEGPTNGIYKPDSEYGSGVCLIRIDDFSFGEFVGFGNFQRIRATKDEIQRYGVKQGDIVINRVNSLSHIGKSVLIPEVNEPTLFESNMMRIRFGKGIAPNFAAMVLLSDNTRRYFKARAKKAVQQASINQQDVSELPVPLPPLKEQRSIATVLEGVGTAVEVARNEHDRLGLLEESTAEALLTGRVRVRVERCFHDDQ